MQAEENIFLTFLGLIESYLTLLYVTTFCGSWDFSSKNNISVWIQFCYLMQRKIRKTSAFWNVLRNTFIYI